jgi:hypothetical protein
LKNKTNLQYTKKKIVERTKNEYRGLVETPEESRLLGRPKDKCKNYITISFKEIGKEGLNCIDLVQDKENGGQL